MAPSMKLDDIYELVANIFDQAQSSLANHKKNCVALFKIHIKAAEVTQPAKHGIGLKAVGEKAFQDVFMDMVSRVLVVKKGPVNADRTVKFVGAFVKFMNEKVLEAKAQNASSSTNADDDEETSTARFVTRLLSWLVQGFVAKNKNVRYRCIHVVSEMISHLGEIDEDAYNELRSALMDRLNDKETLIRAHAVIALAKLVGTEDPDDLEEGEPTILQTLLEVIPTDPAAEVRRAAVVNVPLEPTTIDAVLSRTRDVDPVTRKLVYAVVLPQKLAHPRHLTIAQREQIVKDGLGDREPAVRVAAGKLVASWLDAVLADAPAGGEQAWVGDDAGMMHGLVRFLSLFDVFGPGEAIAVDAVLSILTTRPDVSGAFVFPNEYWKSLSAESALLARVFVEHCVAAKDEAALESAALPVVTAFAFHIQEAYNNMLEVLQEIETAKLLRAGLDEQEVDEELDEELAKREVIMSELLRILLKLDYGDEIGRRKVFSVVKDMLAHPELPPGLIERCLDVLKEIMPSERDLIRLVVEIVVELREGDFEEDEVAEELPPNDDQSDVSQATVRRDRSTRKPKNREDMSNEERSRADLTDIRCLLLCIATLERVNGTFEDNSTLEGILGDLIIPSVKRKELAMREKALVSLGLCCLIAKNMALSSFQLFLSQAQNSPKELKVQVLKIIMDLLIMYDQEFFGRSAETATKIIDFLLQILEVEESAEAQAVLVTGFCKLLLAGMITESRVLTCLALMYISPTTAENQEVRQCLSYFFPVYSYSSPANQDRMQAIFMPTFDLAVRMHDDLEDGQEMISPYQFGQLMVDWTNPRKAAEIALSDTQNLSHVHLATEILVALYDSDRTPDQQKALCQLLAQLDIEHGLDKKSILSLNILLSNHEDQCPFENSAVEKIFNKFHKAFSKTFEKELEEIDAKEHLDDKIRDLYQRIGMDAPEKGGAKRRSRSRGWAKDGDEEEEEEGEEEEEDDEEAYKEAEAESNGEPEKAEDEDMAVEPDAGAENEETGNHSDEAEAETAEVAEKDVDAQEEEEDSREESLTPPPPSPPPPTRAAKRPARQSTKKPKAPAKPKGKKAQQDVEPVESDEENISDEAESETNEPEEKDADAQEEEDSREESLTPPPPSPPPPTRTAKRPTRQSTKKPKAPAKPKGKKAQQDAEPVESDEENIPPEEIVAPKRATRGTKRAATTTDVVPTKRTRVSKAPLKPVAKEETPEVSETEQSPPTPPKPKARATRGRPAKAKATTRKAAPPPPAPESSEDDADEVASSLASPRASPEAPAAGAGSSDDFGGYSD